MQIEDRLDALLTMRLQRSPRQLHSVWVGHDDELTPLLQVADALDPLRTATPSAEFTRSLEQRLLVYATSLATTAQSRASDDEAAHLPNDVVLTGIEMGSQAHERPRLRVRREKQRPQRRWGLWQIAAAVLLLLVTGMMALTAAAAAAGPGSLLFGLHRAEQNVRIQFASSQDDRIRLHLGYADEALSQLNDIVASQAGDPAYVAALAAFLTERQAVAQDLASLPTGGEHDAFATQLDTLTTKAESSLHAALSAISWSDRVATTQALGELGEPVLVVTDVQITHEDGQNAHIIRIVAQGSGFAVGSVITADGQVVGTVISATATQVIVEIDAAGLRLPPHNVGVSNPDGTAAVSPHFEMDNPSDHGHSGGSHPTPVVTPHSH